MNNMLTAKVVPQHLRLGQHRLLASRSITPGRVRARGRQAGLSSRRPALQNSCHPPCPQGALSVCMCNVPPPAVAAVKMLLPQETILSLSRLFSFFFFFQTLAHDLVLDTMRHLCLLVFSAQAESWPRTSKRCFASMTM